MSECKGKPKDKCLPPKCKYTMGKKRQFCRTTKNKTRKTRSPPKKTKSNKSDKSTKSSSVCTPTKSGEKRSLRLPKKDIEKMINCPQTQVYNDITKKCIPRNTPQGITQELKNIDFPKKALCDNLFGPKQKNNNCWFNASIVALFLSDKGSQFTKPMRRYMVREVNAAGEKIVNTKLRRAMKVFNERLELMTRGKHTKTNDIVKLINRSGFDHADEGDFGSPNVFINYMYNTYDFSKHSGQNTMYLMDPSQTSIEQILGLQIQQMMEAGGVTFNYTPNQYIIDVQSEDARNIQKNKQFTIMGETYELDAAIMHSTSQNHWACAFTCDGEGYFHDGMGDPTVIKIDWKNMINNTGSSAQIQLPNSGYRFKFDRSSVFYFYYKK